MLARAAVYWVLTQCQVPYLPSLISSHSTPWRQVLGWPPLPKRGKWGKERLRDLSTDTQLVSLTLMPSCNHHIPLHPPCPRPIATETMTSCSCTKLGCFPQWRWTSGSKHCILCHHLTNDELAKCWTLDNGNSAVDNPEIGPCPHSTSSITLETSIQQEIITWLLKH